LIAIGVLIAITVLLPIAARATQSVYNPNAVTTLEGTHISGGLADVQRSDRKYYKTETIWWGYFKCYIKLSFEEPSEPPGGFDSVIVKVHAYVHGVAPAFRVQVYYDWLNCDIYNLENGHNYFTVAKNTVEYIVISYESYLSGGYISIDHAQVTYNY